MTRTPPLASLPVSFFDEGTGISALAVQHLRCDGRSAIVYHDAPSPAATAPLLAAIAARLIEEMAAGQVLSMIETSMPEHPAETFVYAQVTLWHAAPGRLGASSSRLLSPDAVAAACGISPFELERTEQLVSVIHRPRACAFAGFRQLPLGARSRGLRAVVAA